MPGLEACPGIGIPPGWPPLCSHYPAHQTRWFWLWADSSPLLAPPPTVEYYTSYTVYTELTFYIMASYCTVYNFIKIRDLKPVRDNKK